MTKKNSDPKRKAKAVGIHTKIPDFNDALVDRIQELAREGKTDVQIAADIGVTERALNYWKKNKTFFQSLKDAKNVADSLVEASLFQRACGFSVPEVKTFYNSTLDQVVEHKVVKTYPPDTTAAIFWLKNRQPDRWREKVEQENTNININTEELKREDLSKKTTSELHELINSKLKKL